MTLNISRKGVNRFPYPTGDEVREEGDVSIRNMMISNATIPPVTNVIFRKEIVFIGLELAAIGSGALPSTPEFRQIEAVGV